MPDRDKKKGYIPWHDRINEELIKELAIQFSEVFYKHGIKVSDIKIKWDKDGRMQFDTVGEIRKDD